MHLRELRCFAFRNHQDTRLELGPGLTVVVGRNGQGKTNLLEAIATLALTRSPRAGSLAECIAWGAPAARVTGWTDGGAGPLEVDCRLDRLPSSPERAVRRYCVNGTTRSARAVLGLVPVVLFWPEDLALVKGPPEGRRRLLDVVLSQAHPAYAETALRYRRALEQRNALLRGSGAAGLAPRPLAVWTAALIDHGAPVMAARAALVGTMQPLVAAAAMELGEPTAIAIRYRPGLPTQGVPPEALADPSTAAHVLGAALQAAAEEERLRGITVCGPHRDDLILDLDGRSARAFASQGQQRGIVLAVKAAEVRVIRERLGTTPVVLLDDVFSELDPLRQERLSALLAGEGRELQTLLTTAGAIPAAVHPLHQLVVERGQARPREA